MCPLCILSVPSIRIPSIRSQASSLLCQTTRHPLLTHPHAPSHAASRIHITHHIPLAPQAKKPKAANGNDDAAAAAVAPNQPKPKPVQRPMSKLDREIAAKRAKNELKEKASEREKKKEERAAKAAMPKRPKSGYLCYSEPQAETCRLGGATAHAMWPLRGLRAHPYVAGSRCSSVEAWQRLHGPGPSRVRGAPEAPLMSPDGCTSHDRLRLLAGRQRREARCQGSEPGGRLRRFK